MRTVVGYIVAVAWIIYLGLWLRSRSDRRAMSSISTFSKHLAVLGRTAPARPAQPPGAPRSPGVRGVPAAPPISYAPRQRMMTLSEARARRQQVLTGLVAAATVTAAMVSVGGLPLLVLHLLADVLLVTYVVLLVHIRKAAAERRSKVVYLPRPTARALAEPPYLERSAN